MKPLTFMTSTTVSFNVPVDWNKFSADCGDHATSHDPKNYLELCFDEYDELLHMEDVRPSVAKFLKQVDYTLRLKGIEPDAVGFFR